MTSEPVDFAGGVLKVKFPPSGAMAKTMCESNGRCEQIEKVLSNCCGGAVRLKLEIAAEEDSGNVEPLPGKAPVKAAAKRPGNKELLDDPAIKTVIKGLEAKVTGIRQLP